MHGAPLDLETGELPRLGVEHGVEPLARKLIVMRELVVARDRECRAGPLPRGIPSEHDVEAGAAEARFLRRPIQRFQRSLRSVDSDQDRFRGKSSKLPWFQPMRRAPIWRSSKL
jgi:hypothetical protein